MVLNDFSTRGLCFVWARWLIRSNFGPYNRAQAAQLYTKLPDIVNLKVYFVLAGYSK